MITKIARSVKTVYRSAENGKMAILISVHDRGKGHTNWACKFSHSLICVLVCLWGKWKRSARSLEQMLWTFASVRGVPPGQFLQHFQTAKKLLQTEAE